MKAARDLKAEEEAMLAEAEAEEETKADAQTRAEVQARAEAPGPSMSIWQPKEIEILHKAVGGSGGERCD